MVAFLFTKISFGYPAHAQPYMYIPALLAAAILNSLQRLGPPSADNTSSY